MKNTLCFLALLLLAITAHAQASSGVIRGYVADQFATPLQVGANTVHTMPGGEVFTIEMTAGVIDSLFVLSNPMVKTSRGEIALDLTLDSTLSLDCSEETEAIFFADESRDYQMGFCQQNPSRYRHRRAHRGRR